jgi:apolipoprotein D and lipocalin family protein
MIKKILSALCAVFLVNGCVGPPEGIRPVENFDIGRYLGKWYEIARLDHSFERGLTNVFAEYAPREDGGVKVVNRGYNEGKGEWKSVEGKAYFVESKDTGSLKVSFFGPFYGGYHVIALDREDYSYAMVAGPNRDYLWILSRTERLDGDIVEKLVEQAKNLGFATDELIFVRQDREFEG